VWTLFHGSPKKMRPDVGLNKSTEENRALSPLISTSISKASFASRRRFGRHPFLVLLDVLPFQQKLQVGRVYERFLPFVNSA
jgi:hypothetical protein